MDSITRIRPFLKWAGGKFQIISKIRSSLPEGSRLIEPFLGSGSVFLNTNYEQFLLADINA
ncbi:TPA: DNA adenine methylase, partial [Legionella pneumophila]|nr:DNA adenine methylase [Legionella pneumophila]